LAPSPAPAAADPPLPTTDRHLMKAAPQANNSVSLSWEEASDADGYRVYSDMGTGYGVYLFKAETEQPTLTDIGLRAGSRYQYRVGSITPTGETLVAWASAITPVRSELQAGEHDATTASVEDTSAPAIPKPAPSPVRVTPAPTPLPPDTVILGLLSATDYADNVDDTLTIVGEVRNDSQLDVGQASVIATFYGDNGQVIGEYGGPTILEALAPGIRSPFIITLPRPPGLADYSLRATARPITLATSEAELKVVNTRRFEDTTGFYHIAGVIENPGAKHVEQARVVVTLYDRGGNVINVGFAYPQPSALSPDSRADFDVSFTYYPKVFSHLAIALGN
jgi:hypothetical protein